MNEWNSGTQTPTLFRKVLLKWFCLSTFKCLAPRKTFLVRFEKFDHRSNPLELSKRKSSDSRSVQWFFGSKCFYWIQIFLELWNCGGTYRRILPEVFFRFSPCCGALGYSDYPLEALYPYLLSVSASKATRAMTSLTAVAQHDSFHANPLYPKQQIFNGKNRTSIINKPGEWATCHLPPTLTFQRRDESTIATG